MTIKKFMCIDGNSLINRAFYGVRDLSTKSGIHTNAIFGFVNTYFKLLDEQKPDAVCVCFDMRAKTFRHEKYDGYKAQRKGMPEELAMQMPYIKEMLDYMGVPRLEKEGFEADDLLGTLSKKCEQDGVSCVVVTGDKDSLQLIGEYTRVAIVSTKMGATTTKYYDTEGFKEEYMGLEPTKIIDLKSIMGDKSDNIPGVMGIGEKGAMDLILKFGSLEQVYNNTDSDKITKGTQKKLVENKEMAFLSYELATIDRQVEIELSTGDFILKEQESDKLYDLLSSLELFSTIKKLGLKIPDRAKAVEALELERDFNKYKPLEISKISGAQLLSIACDEDFSGFAVSDGTDIFYSESMKMLEDILKLKPELCTFDSKPLYKFLFKSQKAVDVPLIFDALIGEYLISPSDATYSLEKSVMAHFAYSLDTNENMQTDLFSTAMKEPAILAQKAYFTQLLSQKLKTKLSEAKLLELMYSIELPLVPVLAKMEVLGIKCDTQVLVEYSGHLSELMEKLTGEIYEIAGESFNIASPKQLSEILFVKMGLKGGKKTKTGYSTDADVLEKLKDSSPVVEKILEYRKYAKLKSTYCEGLLKATADDGRIHTSFNQTVTVTGRLSSQDPNLQNIPIRTEDGANIRRSFVAKDGCVLIDADYSQIELRVLAHISDDQRMIEAFESGLDIHTATAAQVFAVSVEGVTPIMRRRAKAVNFGIVYGMAAFSLAEDIGVMVSEAQDYINSYFVVYSGVKKYMDGIKKKAHEDGLVSTMFGRIRALPELKSSNHNIRAFGERVALNMPIQGAAADIMKIAMINVEKRLEKEQMETKMLLQVHDELILEAPFHEEEKAKNILKEEMEGAAMLRVKLAVDVHTGKNWLEAK